MPPSYIAAARVKYATTTKYFRDVTGNGKPPQRKGRIDSRENGRKPRHQHQAAAELCQVEGSGMIFTLTPEHCGRCHALPAVVEAILISQFPARYCYCCCCCWCFCFAAAAFDDADAAAETDADAAALGPELPFNQLSDTSTRILPCFRRVPEPLTGCLLRQTTKRTAARSRK